MISPLRLLSCAVLLLFATAATAKPKLPPWLQEAVDRPMPAICDDADAVVLADIMEIEVSPKGKIERRCFYAVRVRTPEGRENANARVSYNDESDKVSNLRAWLISTNGDIKTYKDKDFVRVEAGSYGSVYTETWVRALSASDRALPGSVFAFEYTINERSIFPQTIWSFQFEDIPCLYSRLDVAVPGDWRVEAKPMNEPKFTYTSQGGAHRWLATNQPAWKVGDWQPTNIVQPAIGVNIYPSEKDAGRTRFTTFEDWSAVGAYTGQLNDPQAQPDAAIRAKVEELTRNCSSDWEKIGALAKYAQAVNYTSVGLDLSNGGGYQPHPASLVFSRNFGDCKDKTALLRAMLACIGIESYAVACRAGSLMEVQSSWPSPFHFDHCITAISLPEGMEARAVVETDLGPLLFFDPTNEMVPLGSLSYRLQGRNVMLQNGGIKGLTRLPIIPRTATVELKSELSRAGDLSGTLRETTCAADAVDERVNYRRLKASQYELALNEWIRKETRYAKVLEWSVDDDTASDCMKIDLKFEAPEFARRLGPTRLIVRPFLVAPRAQFWLNDADDRDPSAPIQIPRRNVQETSVITLPEGYGVDDLPAAAVMEEDFGRFEMVCAVEEGKLTASFSLQLNGKVVPGDSVDRILAFFAAAKKARQARLVVGPAGS